MTETLSINGPRSASINHARTTNGCQVKLIEQQADRSARYPLPEQRGCESSGLIERLPTDTTDADRPRPSDPSHRANPKAGGTAISLFDETGNMVQPWLDAGYTAVTVDLAHPPGETWDGNLCRIGADMLSWVPPRWLAKADVAFVAAFPPCDHLAVSGARWFAGKGLGALADSVRLFERAAFWCEWFGAPYLIENPVSTISTYWRKPDHSFDPHDYAGLCAEDTYTKKTCLWTGGGFVMPAPAPLDGVEADDRIHKAAPGPDRKKFRSATPLGFARAVFAANHAQRADPSRAVTGGGLPAPATSPAS